jgi:hypothetical protein
MRRAVPRITYRWGLNMPYVYNTAARKDAVARALVVLRKRFKSIHHWPHSEQIADVVSELQAERKTLGRFEYFDAIIEVERELDAERSQIFRRPD